MLCAPEDYGLSPEQTLAHCVDRPLPPDFATYWADFREEVASLSSAWHGAVDAPVNQVIIPSMRSVRIVGRLSLPEGPPSGVVVATHGYGTDADLHDEPDPWVPRGMAALRLRVRGFPPSTLDIDDLRDQWITHRIESRDGWILRGAVADLVQGYRCVRRRFGPQMPIMLHGESFGAGLAIIAAAQLQALGDPPARIAIGLPTFGDWRWRRGRYCAGSGGLVNMMHERLRLGSDDLLATLELFDAAFHARNVHLPLLCKLAVRDDAVPAPSAAAVFNALPGSLGTEKWRFIVGYGHFDGGIADARRHVLFERLHPAFLDPTIQPGAALGGVDLDGPAAVERFVRG